MLLTESEQVVVSEPPSAVSFTEWVLCLSGVCMCVVVVVGGGGSGGV